MTLEIVHFNPDHGHREANWTTSFPKLCVRGPILVALGLILLLAPIRSLASPPNLILPPDVSVDCGEDTSTSSTGQATATGSCNPISISHSDSIVVLCGPGQIIYRFWTAIDSCGLSATGYQTISQIDTIPPVFTFIPNDTAVICANLFPDSTAVLTAQAIDNCYLVSVDYYDSLGAGCTIFRRWLAYDSCGNSSSAYQAITLIDTVPPNLVAPEDIVISCGTDMSPVSTGWATESDDCGLDTFRLYSDSLIQGACNNEEIIIRRWTATDFCGNTTSVDQTITVVDTLPPDLFVSIIDSVSLGFTGGFSPGSWTFNSTTSGGDGSVDTTGAPDFIVLNGSDANNGTCCSNYEEFSIIVPQDGLIGFDWSLLDPGHEEAFYTVNGIDYPIALDSGSGTIAAIPVASADIFAFRLYNYYDCCGRGHLTISDFAFKSTPAQNQGCQGEAVSLINPTAIDNCDANPIVTSSNDRGVVLNQDTVLGQLYAIFPLGETNITWTASDDCGNSDTTTLQVVIEVCSSSICNPPSNLFATNITLNSADLNWGVVDSANRYDLRYKAIGTSTWMVINRPDTFTTINNLQPETMYAWQARSVCVLDTSNWSNVSLFTTEAVPCVVPVGLDTSKLSYHRIELSWDPLFIQSSYNLRYKQAGASVWTHITLVGNNTITVTGLTPETTYAWQVRSVCSDGNTAWTTMMFFTTTAVPCPAPVGLGTTLLNCEIIELEWDPVPTANSYHLRYKADQSASWRLISVANTDTTLDDMTNGAIWHVRSVCSGGAGVWSSLVVASDEIVCSEPQGLSAEQLSENQVDLGWDPVICAASYELRYKQSGSLWTEINLVNTEVTINELIPGSNYLWQVKSRCATGVSDWTTLSTFTTAAETCSTPSPLNPSNLTLNSVELHWSAISGASSYDVRYKVSGGSVVTSVNSTDTVVSLSGLSNNTHYVWQVRARCSSLISTWSGWQSFMTEAFVCPATTGLNVADITHNSATLYWDAIPGATNYKIGYKQNGAATWTKMVTVSNSLPISGLTAASNYSWRVRTDCSPNPISNWTAIQTFTTAGSGLRLGFENEPSELLIFPNPSQGNVNIRYDPQSKVDLHIYDPIGRMVFDRQNMESVDLLIDLRSYGKGVYLLWIKENQDIRMQKILIR